MATRTSLTHRLALPTLLSHCSSGEAQLQLFKLSMHDKDARCRAPEAESSSFAIWAWLQGPARSTPP